MKRLATIILVFLVPGTVLGIRTLSDVATPTEPTLIQDAAAVPSAIRPTNPDSDGHIPERVRGDEVVGAGIRAIGECPSQPPPDGEVLRNHQAASADARMGTRPIGAVASAEPPEDPERRVTVAKPEARIGVRPAAPDAPPASDTALDDLLRRDGFSADQARLWATEAYGLIAWLEAHPQASPDEVASKLEGFLRRVPETESSKVRSALQKRMNKESNP